MTVKQHLNEEHEGQGHLNNVSVRMAMMPNVQTSSIKADLTSCEEVKHWYHNGDLVYDDYVILLVLPANAVAQDGNRAS